MSKGQRIGYIRVSSTDQNTERQLNDIELDKIFTDKISGKDTARPQLEAMLSFIREGDTVIIHSMDRLARNLDDLRRIVQLLVKDGIYVHFIKESLIFSPSDASNPISTLMLSILGAFAEFERANIRERQREGIELAKKKGVYKGRKKKFSDSQIEELKSKIASGEKISHLAIEYKVSRETLYKYIKPQ